MTTGGEGGQPPVPRRWREIRRSRPSPSPGFCLKIPLSPRGEGVDFGSRPVSPHKNKPNKERTSRDFFDQKGIYARWEFEKLYNCQRRVTPSLFNRSSSVA